MASASLRHAAPFSGATQCASAAEKTRESVSTAVRCGPIATGEWPPTLAAITATFHKCGVNIIEVQHQRIFTRLPAKDTVIEVECEARDAKAIEQLVGALEDAGFEVERASLD